MASVDADPADLQRFAAQLRRYQADGVQQLDRLSGQLNAMRWSDAQQRRFQTEWDRNARSIRAFMNSIDQHAAYLERKAKQLEDYLR
jgi:uncharacterized protein YukE